jgi:hypothetical protein
MVHSSLDGLLYNILSLDQQKYHLLRVVKQLHKVLLVCRPSENTKNVRGSNTSTSKFNFNIIHFKSGMPTAQPFKTKYGSNGSETVFKHFPGAQESSARNRFCQPM